MQWLTVPKHKIKTRETLGHARRIVDRTSTGGYVKWLAVTISVAFIYVPAAYADRYGLHEAMRDSQAVDGDAMLWLIAAGFVIAVGGKLLKLWDFGWIWTPVAALLVVMMFTLVAQLIIVSPILLAIWYFYFRGKK